MSPNGEDFGDVTQELATLQEQLVSLADIVESVFAESIIALVEGDLSAATEVRLEDYKAHKAWLQADRISVDLLATGQLDLAGVNTVCACIRIALNMKTMADTGVHISRLISACPRENLSSGEAADLVLRMAEITQSMLSDITEALVNRSPVTAQKPQMSCRELQSLSGELFERLSEEVASAKQSGRVAMALVLVGRALAEMGQYVLEVAGDLPATHTDADRAEPSSDAT